MQQATQKQIEWNLKDVLPATSGPQYERMLADLEAKVREVESFRGHLDERVKRPEDMVYLVNLRTEIRELAARLGYWGHLSFSVDTTDAQVKSYMAKMDELTTDVGNRIRFVDLWWKALPEDRAQKLMPQDPELRYFLGRVRAFKDHTLTEAEERIVSLKDVTGATAMDRLREILTSSFRFKDPKTGATITQSELTRYVHDPDPELREAAYRELWRVYAENEGPLTFLYQTVVTDWANENLKLRGYKSPINVRNMDNDVPDAAVETLLQVCRDNRELFHRYFEWKGRRLGITPMSRFHIYAPLTKDKVNIPYEEAEKKVLKVFNAFSPAVGRHAERVFRERHIHVYPAPNKRGGAYCATVTSRMTPYVFMNYTGDASSVKTLAHEMGHAIHSMLAEDRHPLVAHSTLPMAETASVFAEMLLHRELMRDADPESRAAILSDKIGEIYATVMRQAYFVIFEKRAHEMFMKGATADEVSNAYYEDLKEQFGPVQVPEEFKREWTYIPHIYASPFYCYAYSFGMLLSLALYGMYEEQGESFIPKYEALLAAGGSDSPQNIVSKIGVDLSDREFWQKGFNVIRKMVDELEQTAG
ncbi:MAG TPA: M3 family oligoendopeptidase [Candidatus Thermoplasmatota archaeon]|nr:M3 family oligoendopeptidase [Candidatus Thermoplasmatota archaeon]